MKDLIEQFAESAKGTFLAEDRTSNFPSENTIFNRAQEVAAEVMAQREEILSAFIAKHGFEPDAAVQVERRQADGTTVWSIEHRDASRLNSVDPDWDVDRELALAQSKSGKPTDAQLVETTREALESYRFPSELFYFLSEDIDKYEPLMLILRSVLDRWGSCQGKPVPASERLPGPGDCDEAGQCWWFATETESQWPQWVFSRGTGQEQHWLPADAMPRPQ